MIDEPKAVCLVKCHRWERSKNNLLFKYLFMISNNKDIGRKSRTIKVSLHQKKNCLNWKVHILIIYNDFFSTLTTPTQSKNMLLAFEQH
jgi:outer membrane usher protein FimD/PapC